MHFHHLALFVKDLGRSKEFYSKLGFRVIEEFQKPKEHLRFMFMEGLGVRLELIQPAKFKRKKTDHFHFCLGVDDIHKTVQELKDKGIIFDQVPQAGVSCSYFTYFKDPDGYKLELYQLKK